MAFLKYVNGEHSSSFLKTILFSSLKLLTIPNLKLYRISKLQPNKILFIFHFSQTSDEMVFSYKNWLKSWMIFLILILHFPSESRSNWSRLNNWNTGKSICFLTKCLNSRIPGIKNDTRKQWFDIKYEHGIILLKIKMK